MVIYDLLLIITGIIIGVIAADPLKKLFTGGYKEEKRQKKRVKLLLYLREEASREKLTAPVLADKVFKGKEDGETVHQLLEEIEKTGFIKSLKTGDNDWKKQKWFFNKKKMS
ncbi:hypothetical protein [Salipaludibacillus aurantiacus]|uniref:Uncharacterized protein n=1 Tax=Salipaludibacillus aurantiacus TaxID=1601833 RepID=A0A1H9X8X2_9BACI|nr:hypothetical protein [Salipaludibacillus aurantiacus]SES42521.1 hypothetical protein SAMN05518684_12920 [Salipaludibacillus aurantiacus]